MEDKNKHTYTPLPEPVSITKQVWPEGTLPLIHIKTMAYMHEKFIKECLDGILMQKTTFPVQLLIHDDASTDKTADILRECEGKYPGLIKVFYQKENTYTKPDRKERRAEFYSWRKGKYEAICEGDDYWTDPLKLQKQIDFLEKNPDYGMCYTKTLIYLQEYKKFDKKRNLGRYFDTLEDLLTMQRVQIPTMTICTRMDLLLRYYEEMQPYTGGWKVIGDFPLFFWFKINSKIHFIDEFTGVYRIVPGSACHKTTYEDSIKFFDERTQIRLFLINKYNIQNIEKTIIENKKRFYIHSAIKYKKYIEYRNLILNNNNNSFKNKIKKTICKSKFLTIIVVNYLYNKYYIQNFFKKYF